MSNKIYFVGLIALSIMSCKNDVTEEVLKPVPVDHVVAVDFRDSLVGNYEGTEHDYTYIMGGPPTILDTTFSKTLVVSKALDSASVTIGNVNYVLDNTLTYYTVLLPGPVVTSVKFRNDSCLMYFRNGGLGGYQEQTIKVKRN